MGMEPISFTEGNCYNDGKIVVYANGFGEIFVSLCSNDRCRIRVTPRGDTLTVTAHDAVLTPWAVNGLSAFRVKAPSTERR